MDHRPSGAGWLTYGRTKLSNLYFTYELHRRLRALPPGSGGDLVDVNAVHPGVVDTELPRSLSINFYPLLKEIGGLITPEQGARGQVEVAMGDAFEGVRCVLYKSFSPIARFQHLIASPVN